MSKKNRTGSTLDSYFEEKGELRDAVHPKLGSELAALGRRLGGIELDVARDQTPIDPATFE